MLRKSEQKIKRLFLMAVIFSLIFRPAFAEDKIVAIVNCDVITQKDLNDFINFTRMQMSSEHTPQEVENKIKSIKKDLLDKLIEDRIILQEAKKDKIKIDESRVKARIEEVKKRYGSDSNFQAALAGQGLVQADVESRIREQLLMYGIIEAKVRSKIVINPKEVTEFYEKNMEEFKSTAEFQIESLTTEDAEQARQALVNLKSGKEPESLANTGSVSWDKMNIVKGQLRKDIEDVVFKLKPGEVSSPLKIGNKYYIFKLNRIIPPLQQNLNEVRDQVYTFLFNKKMEEELARWLDELKKRSYIKIFAD
jgi:parvulin-like peptidyl-prolyl isomerase